jgi:hypothetical protein
MTARAGADVQLFVHHLEERRVLSVAPFFAGALPAVLSSPAVMDSVENQTTDASRVAEQSQTGLESANAPRADRMAELVGQSVALPPGSSGLVHALRLHADDAAHEVEAPLEEDIDNSGFTNPLESLDESGLGPGLDSMTPPTASVPLPGGDELFAPVADDPSDGGGLSAAASAAESPEASVAEQEEATVSSVLPDESEGASTAVEVGDTSTAAALPVFLEGPPVSESDQLAIALSTGDLAALRRALEAMLLELGKLDPTAGDASTRIALLMWLSAAAAATTAGCLIARRQLKGVESASAAAPSQQTPSRAHLYEPLLA